MSDNYILMFLIFQGLPPFLPFWWLSYLQPFFDPFLLFFEERAALLTEVSLKLILQEV
jgi:hypothetical protein